MHFSKVVRRADLVECETKRLLLFNCHLCLYLYLRVLPIKSDRIRSDSLACPLIGCLPVRSETEHANLEQRNQVRQFAYMTVLSSLEPISRHFAIVLCSARPGDQIAQSPVHLRALIATGGSLVCGLIYIAARNRCAHEQRAIDEPLRATTKSERYTDIIRLLRMPFKQPRAHVVELSSSSFESWPLW